MGAVVVWAGVHSWLASLRVKVLARRLWRDKGARVYRLAYNALAAVSFVPILVLMRALPDHLIYMAASPWLYLMLAAQALSALFLLLVLRQTDVLSFAGLRQLAEGEVQPKLVTKGYYAWVRHPLYLFGLLFLWLTPVMTANMLVIYISLTVYIFIGALLEEQRLLWEFGSEYSDYKSRTPMILPGLGLRRNQVRSPRPLKKP
jgi:protein-S-isoprenylcysteine O-methyltransferase Ste14